MKRKSIIILIAMILSVLIIIVSINIYNKTVIKYSDYLGNAAQFIWTTDVTIPEGYAPGEWVCFRKNFEVDEIPSSAELDIVAESKYWLSDGGLKRGESPNTTYYDRCDATKYLKKGNNNISVLVWYYGKSGYSNVDSGH